MNIAEEQIQEIVKRVISNLGTQTSGSGPAAQSSSASAKPQVNPVSGKWGVFDTVEETI